ncbi:Transposon Ty3-G Gag-Pol polyprotein [Dictyocoela muelleri]|nr:Transposon Ty3-G Gag-Pol polyprotein [Dictyocoela muelleri]
MLLRDSAYTFKKVKGGRKSNPKEQAFDDNVKENRCFKNKFQTDKKLENFGKTASTFNSQTTFRKGMTEKEVHRELFMIEGEDNFEHLSLRSKMTQCIRRSSVDLRDWYFDLGASGLLSESWDMFKNSVINFCCEQGLDSVHKYQDEFWSEYITRLNDKIIQIKGSENQVFAKLRKEKSPKTLQVIFYSFNISLKEAIERVKEWESFTYKPKRYYKSWRNLSQSNENNVRKQNLNKSKSEIVCYKCKEKGHYSNRCPNKTEHINSFDKVVNVKNKLDIENIEIDNKSIPVIFDSGASESVITSRMLDNVKPNKIVNVNKEFSLIDGSIVKIEKAAVINFLYKNTRFTESFNIVRNARTAEILLCNSIVKKIRNLKTLPVECSIDTISDSPVSWNRPITSWKNKIEFEKLVKDLEKKKIVEPSISKWLNPVVLTRKRSGEMRFCVDFRRLNDIVKQDNFEIPRIQEIYLSCMERNILQKSTSKMVFFKFLYE